MEALLSVRLTLHLNTARFTQQQRNIHIKLDTFICLMGVISHSQLRIICVQCRSTKLWQFAVKNLTTSTQLHVGCQSKLSLAPSFTQTPLFKRFSFNPITYFCDVCVFLFLQTTTNSSTHKRKETLRTKHDYLVPVCFRGLFATIKRQSS